MVTLRDLFISAAFVMLYASLSSSMPSLPQSLRNSGHLALYPRVGKRFAIPRRDFLNVLADKWQRTGSLRGAVREIQDMTEKKRSAPAADNFVQSEDAGDAPPFLLLVRRDLLSAQDGFVQPEEDYFYNNEFFFKPYGRRNYIA